MSMSRCPLRASVWLLVPAIALLPTLVGCGSGKFPVAKAKGKVICNGQPVTSGSVTFSPMGEADSLEVGKSATATVGSDGTFVLTTDNRFDGAVVGKHRVQYVGEEGEESEEESAATPAEGSPEEAAQSAKRDQQEAKRKSQCVQTGEIVVEVKADGNNDFTIELAPAGN